MSRVHKDFFGDGYTVYHDDGTKSHTTKDTFGGGWTTQNSDGSYSHHYQVNKPYGSYVESYDSNGRKIRTEANRDGSYTSTYDDGRKVEYHRGLISGEWKTRVISEGSPNAFGPKMDDDDAHSYYLPNYYDSPRNDYNTHDYYESPEERRRIYLKSRYSSLADYRPLRAILSLIAFAFLPFIGILASLSDLELNIFYDSRNVLRHLFFSPLYSCTVIPSLIVFIYLISPRRHSAALDGKGKNYLILIRSKPLERIAFHMYLLAPFLMVLFCNAGLIIYHFKNSSESVATWLMEMNLFTKLSATAVIYLAILYTVYLFWITIHFCDLPELAPAIRRYGLLIFPSFLVEYLTCYFPWIDLSESFISDIAIVIAAAATTLAALFITIKCFRNYSPEKSRRKEF